MRCEGCGENFDEVVYGVYSNICPKCGYFNKVQEECDVSSWFSAEFDDGGKVSASEQAAKQHEERHKTYGGNDVHQQGMQQAKSSPYQQRNTYQPGSAGTYRQGNTGKTGKLEPFRMGTSHSKQEYRKRAKLSGEVKEKNLVTPICIVISVLAIIITAAGCYIKWVRLKEIYCTLDYEQEFAEAGEIFEINGRMIIVEKAEVVDTSMLDDISVHIPVEDKLVAVTVDILPTDETDRGRSEETSLVYMSDGYSYRKNLDYFALGDILIKEASEDGESAYYVTDDIAKELYFMERFDEKEVLSEYDYLYYHYASEGKTGKYYFLAAKDADEVTISFDLGREKSGISVLEKRVSVPLVLEEETP